MFSCHYRREREGKLAIEVEVFFLCLFRRLCSNLHCSVSKENSLLYYLASYFLRSETRRNKQSSAGEKFFFSRQHERRRNCSFTEFLCWLITYTLFSVLYNNVVDVDGGAWNIEFLSFFPFLS